MKCIIFCILLAVLSGCSAQQQATAAAAVATSMNASLPLLIETYKQEGLDAIRRAPDRATAEAELAEIEGRWRPVWVAWDALASAEVYQAVVEHYCSLMWNWPLERKPIQVIQCEN
jgi:hypothetical protein